MGLMDNVLMAPTKYGKRVIDSVGGDHALLANTSSRRSWSRNVPSGMVGRSLKLDGTNDVAKTASTSLIPVGIMSLSAWIYPLGYGGGNAGRLIDDGKFQAWYGAVGRIYFSSDGITTCSTAGSAITNSQWQNVIFTRAADGATTFYVNGTMSSTAGLASGTPTAGSTVVCIGNRNAADRAFYGSLKQLTLFDSVLSAEDIAAIVAKTATTAVPINKWVA